MWHWTDKPAVFLMPPHRLKFSGEGAAGDWGEAGPQLLEACSKLFRSQELDNASKWVVPAFALPALTPLIRRLAYLLPDKGHCMLVEVRRMSVLVPGFALPALGVWPDEGGPLQSVDVRCMSVMLPKPHLLDGCDTGPYIYASLGTPVPCQPRAAACQSRGSAHLSRCTACPWRRNAYL